MKKPIKQVHANLYRSSRPESVEQLKDFGVVINVESGTLEKFTNDEYELNSPEGLHSGILFVDLRCSNLTPPTKDQVEYFLHLVGQARRNKQKVLVHCLSGVDRTGFMCAAYRMKMQGWSYNKAKAEYIGEGQHWWYRWWIPFLKLR